ncbi:MAG: alpha/beta hydrolase [Burkholderiaceae bacterium]
MADDGLKPTTDDATPRDGDLTNQEAPDRFVELPDGMQICYQQHGFPDDPVVVLVSGLSMQSLSWPMYFVQGLVDLGYCVLTPDNRDVGRSSRVNTRAPNRLRQLFAQPTASSYDLDDMADDLIRLVVQLGYRRAHVIGMSMGGMIAQMMAARHPELIASLTSIFSTTGEPWVGRPSPSTLRVMARAGLTRTREQAVQRFLTMFRHIGDPSVPGMVQTWTEYAQRAWDRNGGKVETEGVARQLAAIQKSGDRTAVLRRIQVPTLVLHGDRDLMVDPSGGRATARAIPGARLHTIIGLRHQIDPHHTPEMLREIGEMLRDAD